MKKFNDIGGRGGQSERLRREIESLREDIEMMDDSLSGSARDRYELARDNMSHLSERLDKSDDLADDEWEQFKQDMEDYGGDVRELINVYKGGSAHNERTDSQEIVGE